MESYSICPFVSGYQLRKHSVFRLHAGSRCQISLLSWKSNIRCICHISFIPSSVDGHMGHFHIGIDIF